MMSGLFRQNALFSHVGNFINIILKADKNKIDKLQKSRTDVAGMWKGRIEFDYVICLSKCFRGICNTNFVYF